MAMTVNEAFTEFLRDSVNLDPQISGKARDSRSWLIDQIHGFDDDDDFPRLFNDFDIAFGSFARKTKIRELDDIDQMIGLAARGASYLEYSGRIEITVPKESEPLHQYCDPNTDILNSKKIINKFVSALGQIPQYEKADIHRNQEAATLKLRSYTWNFDIVPCFFTNPEYDGRTFYIIPDGSGNWKKTDPRIDRDICAEQNKRHGGNMLNAIRIMKFWNSRRTAPAMPSYLLETMLLRYYIGQPNPASEFVDIQIPSLLLHIRDSVYHQVLDIKNIQGDINNLAFEEKVAIAARANADCSRSIAAREAENKRDHKTSIEKWKEIFGPLFPDYGD